METHRRTCRLWDRNVVPIETSPVKPRELPGRTRSPGGSDMARMRRDSEIVILVNGKALMSRAT